MRQQLGLHCHLVGHAFPGERTGAAQPAGVPTEQSPYPGTRYPLPEWWPANEREKPVDVTTLIGPQGLVQGQCNCKDALAAGAGGAILSKWHSLPCGLCPINSVLRLQKVGSAVESLGFPLAVLDARASPQRTPDILRPRPDPQGSTFCRPHRMPAPTHRTGQPGIVTLCHDRCPLL